MDKMMEMNNMNNIKEHGIVENMNNYFLGGSDCERRDLVEGYHRFSDLLSNLKGEKKYSRK